MREWALVIFTVLGQASVGAFVALQIIRWLANRKDGAEAADKFTNRALLVVFPMTLLAMIASLFHLGNPLVAYRAISNLGTSWLSREILLTVLFAAVTLVYTFMQYRKVASAMVRDVVAVANIVIGLLLVLSMSAVYMLPNQTAWNTPVTALVFFLTAGLAGTVTVAAALVATVKAQDELLGQTLRNMAIAAIILASIQLLLAPMELALGETALEGSILTMLIGSALAFIVAVVAAIFLYQGSQASKKTGLLVGSTYALLVLVAVAEVVGRLMFYTSHHQIGL